jgi:hypothetical protein
MRVVLVCLLSFLSACTYSVSVVGTQGKASDVVDEVQKNEVSPNLTVPEKLL